MIRFMIDEMNACHDAWLQNTKPEIISIGAWRFGQEMNSAPVKCTDFDEEAVLHGNHG